MAILWTLKLSSILNVEVKRINPPLLLDIIIIIKATLVKKYPSSLSICLPAILIHRKEAVVTGWFTVTVGKLIPCTLPFSDSNHLQASTLHTENGFLP